MIVPLVVVLAIADDVHIMQHYDEARRHGIGRGRVQVDACRTCWRRSSAPAARRRWAWLSLATSSVVAVREFGLGSAIGVMVDFAISIVLVPTLLGVAEARDGSAAAGGVVQAAARCAIGAVLHAPRARLVVGRRVVAGVVAAGRVWRGCAWTRTTSISSARTTRSAGRRAVIDRKLAASTPSRSCSRVRPIRMQQPDALAAHGPARSGAARAAVRAQGDRPGRLREARARRARAAAQAVVPADGRRWSRRNCSCSRWPTKGARETRARRGERLLEGADHREAGVDELRPGVRADQRGRTARASTRSRAPASGRRSPDRAGCSARSTTTWSSSQISSFATAFVTVFAVIFLVFRSWRFGLLAIVPEPVSGARDLRRDGLAGHLAERRDRHAGQRRARRRGRRHDSFHQPVPARDARGAATTEAIEVGDDARGPRVADDGGDQQLRVRRARAVRVQADRVVRRPAGADDGRRRSWRRSSSCRRRSSCCRGCLAPTGCMPTASR